MLNFLYVGIGQCGNKFVDSFAFHKNNAIAINTTQKDMESLQNLNKQNLINIIASGTKGGAGKTPALGSKAMKEHINEVLEKIMNVSQDSDYIFLWAGLGGGTGSGGLPVLLQELLNAKKKVLLGLTLPDDTEGVEVQVNAFNACLQILKMIEPYHVPYLLIENNKIKNKMNVVNDFDWRNVNQTISKIFTQFNKSANKPSPYYTFDETDFKKTLFVKGMMSLVKVTLDKSDIKTDNSVKDAIVNAWEKDNFFVDFDYSTASILTTVIEAPDNFLKDKSNYKLIESSLLKLRDCCGTVSPYNGIYPYDEKKESHNNKIIIYCMLTGLKTPIDKLNALKEKATREQAEMKRKTAENNVDLSSFSSLGGVFDEAENSSGLDMIGLDEGEEKDNFDFI